MGARLFHVEQLLGSGNLLGVDVDGDDEALGGLDVVAVVGIEDQHPLGQTKPIFGGGNAIHCLQGLKAVCVKLAMEIGFQGMGTNDDRLAGHNPDGPILIQEHLLQP